MRYYIYNNGDARNHGCEAIIRSTAQMLGNSKDDIGYTSFESKADYDYGLDEICNIIDCRTNIVEYKSLKYYYFMGLLKFGINRYTEYVFKNLLQNADGWDVALSVGGDNYCYKNAIDNLAYINKRILSKIPKMVLWGVSIEPTLLSDSKVLKDLASYHAIFCRESITYQSLIDAGLTNKIFLFPDPAFTLETQETTLPIGFASGKTIGVNLSPLVEDLGSCVAENYYELIQYIIDNTDCTVALIPHVVMPGNDDRIAQEKIYDRFKDSGRVINIPDMNCMQLKWIISHCRFFVGARTHATIAAYSTCVPTLVAGYSVKAKGIAKDLFGTYEGYVMPVQNMKSNSDLTTAFRHLYSQEDKIRQHLQSIIPGFICQSKLAGVELNKLL